MLHIRVEQISQKTPAHPDLQQQLDELQQLELAPLVPPEVLVGPQAAPFGPSEQVLVEEASLAASEADKVESERRAAASEEAVDKEAEGAELRDAPSQRELMELKIPKICLCSLQDEIKPIYDLVFVSRIRKWVSDKKLVLIPDTVGGGYGLSVTM